MSPSRGPPESETPAPVPPGRLFNVAVVGLSGPDSLKGNQGIGKSCLCNRFVRPNADDFSRDHPSIVSQGDFSSSLVINNTHFLFWGTATCRAAGRGSLGNEDTPSHSRNATLVFNVVEQTEFVDDKSFMPFKGLENERYVKRCAHTKLTSHEKVMYICKQQIGVEQEFEQVKMPDGKLAVDGFVLCMDVSKVENRQFDDQIQFCSQIYSNLAKTKKPVVVAFTKCDSLYQPHYAAAEKFVNSKKNLTAIETSAVNGINCDLPFIALALMIDKNRGGGFKFKNTSIVEAEKLKREVTDNASASFLTLLLMKVREHKMSWKQFEAENRADSKFRTYIELLGTNHAKHQFRRHLTKLRDEFIKQKMFNFYKNLPIALQTLYPTTDSIGSMSWEEVIEDMKTLPQFSQYFVQLPPPDWTTHLDTALYPPGDDRIPLEVLSSPDAHICFKYHLERLRATQIRAQMQEELTRVLTSSPLISAGQSWAQVQHFFASTHCHNQLTEADRLAVFSSVQSNLKLAAITDFHELMLEKAESLLGFIRQLGTLGADQMQLQPDQISHVLSLLQDDPRFEAMSNLENDRDQLITQHLNFLCNPSPEMCFFADFCIAKLAPSILATGFKHSVMNLSELSTPESASSSPHKSPSRLQQKPPQHMSFQCLPPPANDSPDDTVNVAIISSAQTLNHQLQKQILTLHGERKLPLTPSSSTTRLCLKSFSGDVSEIQTSITSDDFAITACLCPYWSESSLLFVSKTLDALLEPPGTSGHPLIVILCCSSSFGGSGEGAERGRLLDMGQSRLATRLNCPLLDASCGDEMAAGEKIPTAQMQEVFRFVSDFRRRRWRPRGELDGGRSCSEERCLDGCGELFYQSTSVLNIPKPEMHIVMCVLCGEPFDLALVLGPLLSSAHCAPSPDNAHCLLYHTYLGMSKRVIKVQVVAYHSLGQLVAAADTTIHGVILVYSACRVASFVNLSLFGELNPSLGCCPCLILAVTEPSAATAAAQSDSSSAAALTQTLISEGAALAQHINSRFLTVTANFATHTAALSPFLKDAWEQRGERERVCRLDRMRRQATATRSSAAAQRPVLQSRPAKLPTVPLHVSTGSRLDPSPKEGGRRGSPGAIYSSAEHSRNKVCSSHSSLEICSPSRSAAQRPTGGATQPPPPTSSPLRRPYSWVDNDAVSSLNSDGSGGGGGGGGERGVLASESGLYESVEMIDTPPSHSSSNRPKDSRRKAGGSATGGSRASNGGSSSRDPLSVSEWPDNVYARVNKSPNSSAAGERASSGGGGRSPINVWHGKSKSELTPALPAITQDRLIYEFDSSGGSGELCSRGMGGKATARKSDSLPRELDQPISSSRDSNLSKQSQQSSFDQSRNSSISQSNATNSNKSELSNGGGGGGGDSISPNDDYSPEDHIYDEVAQEEVSAFIPAPNESTPPSSQSKSDHKSSRKGKLKKEKSFSKPRWYQKASSGNASSPSATRAAVSASSGSYFGLPLEDLVRSDSDRDTISPPVFLTKCIELIELRGLRSEGLYRTPGNQADRQALQLRFEEDPGVDIASLGLPLDSVASALKHFFSELPQPLIPTEFHHTLTSAVAQGDEQTIKATISSLPAANLLTLKCLIAHLNRVAGESAANKMSPENLATCFWPTLMRPSYHSLEAMNESYKFRNLVETLISDFTFYFSTAS